jgi:RNA polymerase sigma factor (sigma-70 family)
LTHCEQTGLRELVLQHWDLLERLAARRFPSANAASEALLYVGRALEADDWRRVRAFEGKARFSTFIGHVAYNLLEDFARQRYGRVRVPKWVKAMGSLWEQVYRLLCFERASETDVVQKLVASAPGKRSAGLIEEAIGLILEKAPECGQNRAETLLADPAFLDHQQPLHPTALQLSPEDLMAARQRAAIVTALGECLLAAENPAAERDAVARSFVTKLRPQLKLTAEDRLLLKMVYQDGLKVSAAGRLLGLQQDQVHGRLRRLLQSLRNAFEESGIDEELKVLLNDPGH